MGSALAVMGRIAFALILLGALAGRAFAEDGHDLWLRYRPLEAAQAADVQAHARGLAPQGDSPTLALATAELHRAVGGLTGQTPALASAADAGPGVILYGRADTPAIAALALDTRDLGAEGYRIRTVGTGECTTTVVTANADIGVLYGVFALIRRMQTGQSLDGLDIASAPRLKLRVLDHWDNLDQSVERGYAGQSIWDWHTLPDYTPALYTEYARANASIGVNGAVLNNVNASADSLTGPYIAKAAALAGVFRPWGMRVYLSARFSAPIEIGGLDTADPLDPRVQAWWKAKADEIYAAIPDFGGFLVKANSEGQPGPQDYHRTHADGANMLADALAPHGGVVMWRAFVYAADNADDRAKQAYAEFTPLDGRFRDNVLLQVKNGPIDFQPREPFHPLFGAMPHTSVMMEVQLTKEYLGFATHLAYLGPLFEETLQSDTFRPAEGSTVARVIDGSTDGRMLTGMAGVANIGSDRNWTGSHFNQANWYAFGRFAWDPEAARAQPIAEEWTKMTFGDDPHLVGPVVGMMMRSREAVVDYMTPLGLHHLMATGHHYGPGLWVSDLSRPEWNPTYYHRADRKGVGFDRTAAGSDAVGQYAPEVAARFADLDRVPDQDLLWFHHLPWTYRMRSGRTLWTELVTRYDHGIAEVGAMRETWAGLKPWIDAERFADVSAFLGIQEKEARWWRDASLAYFTDLNGLPLPPGSPLPEHPLAWYEALSFPNAPGH